MPNLSAERLRDWGLLLACNLIWSSQFVLVKIVQEQMGPVAATFFPMTLATLMLIPILWREGKLNKRIPTRDVLEFILIGVFGQVVAQLFITWGVRFSLASNAALITLALPVATAVMAYFFLRERMSAIRWISFALAIGGVIECSGVDWKELDLTSSKFFWGNVMIFLSVNGSAFYNVYSKKLLERYSPLRVLLVDDGSPHLPLLRDELVRLGAEVLAVLDAAVELAASVAQLDPDLVIIGADSPSRDTLEHIAVMSQAAPRPIVLFTDDPDRSRMQRAIRAGVSSYVVAGLAPERLGPILDVALARFETDAELRAELDAARGQLQARKQIEKAKGILMQARGLSEEQAYREMRKMAMDRGVKLAQIAERIIDAKSMLS